MRTAAHVLVGYLLLLCAGVMWQYLPLGFAMPDLVACFAVYLGLTARPVVVANQPLRMAPATLAAIILGYLADLLGGTPRGTMALAAGLVCIAGQLVQRQLILRGLLAAVGLAFFAGLLSGIIILIVRAWGGVLTGLIGPLVFRLCRAIDARFARTARERDAVLGGLSQ